MGFTRAPRYWNRHSKPAPVGHRILSKSKCTYWLIKVAEPDVYYLEHRVVAAVKLGRDLHPAEVAHHINEDTLDNRPENIEVMTKSAHTIHHHLGRRIGRWSKKSDACQNCGTTERPHDCRELCHACREYFRVNGKHRSPTTTLRGSRSYLPQ